MKREMDKIQFENRSEIENILEAISSYVTENPEEKSNKDLKRLYNLLDLMDIEW